jgi:hypothetical protein
MSRLFLRCHFVQQGKLRTGRLLLLSQGTISLHADGLLHGSLPNESADRVRCGITMRYCPTEVRNLPSRSKGGRGIGE